MRRENTTEWKWFYSVALKWILNHVSLQVLSCLNLSWQIASENLANLSVIFMQFVPATLQEFSAKNAWHFSNKNHVLMGLYEGSLNLE